MAAEVVAAPAAPAAPPAKGKGKAAAPYEFGVKVSIATSLAHSKGGQFIVHAKALPRKPYDGHTLATVIPEIEQLAGATLQRILADAGYKGHNAPQEHRFKVYTVGQKRRMTDAIKREMRRRSVVEPVIGMPRPNTAWAGIISRDKPETPSTLSSPPPVTTSSASWLGSTFCCRQSGWRSTRQPRQKQPTKLLEPPSSRTTGIGIPRAVANMPAVRLSRGLLNRAVDAQGTSKLVASSASPLVYVPVGKYRGRRQI